MPLYWSQTGIKYKPPPIIQRGKALTIKHHPRHVGSHCILQPLSSVLRLRSRRCWVCLSPSYGSTFCSVASVPMVNVQRCMRTRYSATSSFTCQTLLVLVSTCCQRSSPSQALVVRVLDSGILDRVFDPHTGHGSILKLRRFHLSQFASAYKPSKLAKADYPGNDWLCVSLAKK